MKRAAAKLVELLPASRAANPWVMLVLTPLLMFFGSITYLPSADHDNVYVFAALVISRLASSVLVMSAKPILFRLFSKPSAWRLILLYLVGGLGDSIVLIAMLDIPWIPLGSGLSSWAVISVSAIVVAAWLLMGHLALALLLQNIKNYAELQTKNAQLQKLVDNANSELRKHQTQLQTEISERVQRVLDRISAQLEQLNFKSDPTQILETAASIREASEADIRGLSHELSAPVNANFLPDLPNRKTNWRQFARISVEGSAHISWVVAVGSLMAFSLAMAVGGWLTAAVVAVALIVGVPILWITDRGRRAMSKRWPIWLRVVSVPVEYVGLVLVGVEIVRQLTRDLEEIQSILNLFEIAVPIGAVLIWLLIFVIQGLSNSIQERSIDLEKASRALELTIERLQSQLREVRNRIARLLHGSVQGRLASVSLALAATAGENDKAISDEMGFKARAQLELARKDLAEAFAENRDVPVFSRALGDLLSSWSGLIEFDLNLDQEISDLLDAEPLLGEIVAHAVQECFTNAVRHGSARNIQLAFVLSNSDEPILKLTAKNDGNFATKEFKPGLGWQTMIADAASVNMSALDSAFQVEITWPVIQSRLVAS